MYVTVYETGKNMTALEILHLSPLCGSQSMDVCTSTANVFDYAIFDEHTLMEFGFVMFFVVLGGKEFAVYKQCGRHRCVCLKL